MSGRKLVFLGGTGLIIGAVLPWVNLTSGLTGTVSISGLKGDGVITCGIGVLLFLGTILVGRKPGKVYSWASGFFGLVALFIAGSKICALTGTSTNYVLVEIGLGIWVSIIAAFLAMVGGFTRTPAGPAPIESMVDTAPMASAGPAPIEPAVDIAPMAPAEPAPIEPAVDIAPTQTPGEPQQNRPQQVAENIGLHRTQKEPEHLTPGQNKILMIAAVILGVSALLCFGSILWRNLANLSPHQIAPQPTVIYYPTLPPEWTTAPTGFCDSFTEATWSGVTFSQIRRATNIVNTANAASYAPDVDSTEIDAAKALRIEVAGTAYPACAANARQHFLNSIDYLVRALSEDIVGVPNSGGADLQLALAEGHSMSAEMNYLASCAPTSSCSQ